MKDEPIWCKRCQCWADPRTWKMFINDANRVEFLCSGCDVELKPSESTDDFVERLETWIKRGVQRIY